MDLQLTRPPAGWTDEAPSVLRDGSILFVRTRLTSHKVSGEWYVTLIGDLMVLGRGKLTSVARMRVTGEEANGFGRINYYGHYGWR